MATSTIVTIDVYHVLVLTDFTINKQLNVKKILTMFI